MRFMKRRTWLQLGLASGVVLALGGGAVALIEPGLRAGRLSTAGKTVFTAVGRAVLDGSLPADANLQSKAIEGLLERLDILIGNLPPHAQAEISQLLALLGSGVGRVSVAGLSSPWPEAGVAQIQGALQSMRSSTLSLKQQAYHALHDLVAGAYFSDANTWRQLGYPGPVPT
jgi:hypothetical protein